MPFKKRLLGSEIAFVISAGLFLAASPKSADAQLPQYTCRPNDAGDGWVCESTGPIESRNTADGTNRYNSDDSVLPGGAETQRRPTFQFPILPTQELEEDTEEETEAETEEESTESSEELEDPDQASATQQPAFPLVPAAPVQEPVPEVEARPIVAVTSEYELDWVPREELTEELLTTVPDNCCGTYIDPAATLLDPANDPANAGITFLSNTGLSQINQNLITIDGDVIVQQGYRTIQNDTTTTIDRGENTVLLDGNVEFREPGILLLGTSAYIDSNDSINRVEEAQYVLHNFGAHGNAASIVYSADSGLVSIENGEFSRCEPGSNFWKLRADSIVLDQAANRGYADNVSLRLGDFPIFYYPGTMPFPLGDERISGFLAPSTGSTRSGGFDFELPYYFNLAPHYDATLSPRIISDRGTLVGLETRYLSSWSMNTLNLSGLSGDKLYDPTTINIPGTESPPVEDRWFVGLEHRGVIGRNFSTFIDYNAVSDEDYFYDLGSSGLNLTSRTHLNRQGRVNFNSDYLRAGLNVQRIEIIDPFYARSNINKPFDRLPQFYFESNAYLWGGFRVGIRGEVTSFDRNLDNSLLTMTQLDNGALVNGERFNAEPEIGWSIESPGWFVRTNAKYKHVQYKLQNQALGTIEDPDIGIGIYSADAGLVFERDMSRGNGWRQTLEPRLFYLYSDFEDQNALPLFDTSELNFSFNQLFRDDRFSGGDRIADADQAAFALTSRILNPDGKETARMSIGQIRYFEDRLVTLTNPLQTWLPRHSPLTTKSALAGELALSLGDNWRLNTDVQWNEDTEEIDEGSVQLRYHRDEDHLVNFDYRFRSLVNTPNFILPSGIDPRIKQTDVSAVWPVNENWRLLARWNYDHSNSRNLESFAGIEWSNCCATIRLIGREWVDEDKLFLPNIEPDRGIFVQFTLNGLGNLTGGGLSNLLTDSIWGFRETDYGL
ncbi:MAG: LPS assembly protein LptD [Pseudomonadales bacterium]|nr:LPS assembly protein LptD [Pseudomonadales bacterium]